MSLSKYLMACAKQAVYPFNYFLAWCEYFPNMNDFEADVKAKRFGDFLRGASVDVEYKADTHGLLIRRGKESRLVK